MTAPLRCLAALAVMLLSLLPVAASAVSTTPARVGDCVALDLTDRVAVAGRSARFDNVFVARIADVTGGASTDGASRRPRVYHVVVEVNLKGNLPMGEGLRVVLTSSGMGVGAGLEKGERYVMFARGAASPLQADACEGYTSATTLDADRIETIRKDLNPAPPTSEVVISKPRDGADDAPDLGRLGAPGGAISLIGVLGLVLLSRVGRQRH